MFADRMGGVDMSGIRKMFELAGADAINFGIGEPDFQPPEFIIDAFEKALRSGKNNYGPSQGILELREAIAAKERDRSGELTADGVVVTAGSTSGLYGIMQAFLNPGDEVLVPDPGFVLYAPHVRLAEGHPVFYPVLEDKRYVPQVEDLDRLVTPKTKMVVLNTPSNPTGGTIPVRDVERLAEWARSRRLVLVSDEAYDAITYEEPHASFLGKYENVIYVNTFSKTYAMTGWRIGYVCTNKVYADALKKMNYHLVACPPTPTQYACLAALEGPADFVKSMVTTFRERRDLITKLMRDVPGLHMDPPRGAFYAFPSYRFEMDCKELAMHLLRAGVVTTPGDAFGAKGAGHLRFSYATSTDNIRRGLAIVKKVVEGLPR
ncbi:MAG TPA: pyridoxal phosphate-dependent aminotransferase [Candidatus Thermoplasmatota archaeon]|nr:pyridoxal phosphate-dependent aminotransferase [Candidatus Thermoplasmatota archaeon]